MNIGDEEELTLFLMSIYDKAIQENISDNRLEGLVDEVIEDFINNSSKEEE